MGGKNSSKRGEMARDPSPKPPGFFDSHSKKGNGSPPRSVPRNGARVAEAGRTWA